MKINQFFPFLYFLPVIVFSQPTVPMSKSEVLEKVITQNNQLKIGEQQVLSAKGNFNQTNAVFLLNITASHSGMSTANPLMTFGFKLNQEIVPQANFDPNRLNNPSQIQKFATKFEVQQNNPHSQDGV